MDEDISRWIMEFLLRQKTSDQIINKLLTKLPVAKDNFRLKKTLLLRSIQSEISDGSVSETILDHLKTIQDLDKKEGIKTTSSMKEAFCAVAVECAVKYLGGSVDKGGKYWEAVERIWRGKIENLAESELVTAELMKWKDEIEAATWDDEVRSKLLKKNTRNDALRLVRAYLAEAWAIMGPSFLELAVAKMKELESNGGDVAGDRAAAREKGIHKENVLLKRKHVSAYRRARGPVKITDNEESSMDASCSKYDTLPTPEVDKVQEALKSSSLELQAVVRDPLPDALRSAEALLSDMHGEKQNHDPLVEKQDNVEKDVQNPSVTASIEPVKANEVNHRDQSCSHQNNVSKPNLMERNSTAHTYEWDDSIDDSPGGPSNRLDRYHLPSPKRLAVSPLKKHEITKYAKRRKKKRWSLEEEEALRNGVQEFGMGNWKIILKSNPQTFAERTEVDLKDKWRNLMRY